MTYLEFHLAFTVPPVLVLAVHLLRAGGRQWLRRKFKPILVLVVIAVAYTTPWDNYLVFRNVWSYGPDRVLATIGFVPVEEYAFFILQTILTGLLLLALGRRTMKAAGEALGNAATKSVARTPVGIGLGLIAVAGIICLRNTSTFYLGLILTWAAPVMLLQWLLGARAISDSYRHTVPAIAISSVYLSVADLIAISTGTWSISEEFTTGIRVVGLPVEEVLFFLVTNIMVVWGLVLFDHFTTLSSPQRSPSNDWSIIRQRFQP